MKKFTQILGLVGMVGLGVGFLALLVGRRLNLFIELQLLVGGMLALLGLAANLSGLREYFLKRAGKAQSEAVVQITGLVIALLLVDYIAYQHNWLWDVTSNNLYTLAPRTKQILNELPGPIKLTAFLPTEGSDKVKSLLKLFLKESNKLELEIIDPDRHPERAEAKSISTYGTVIFEFKGRETRVVEPVEEDIINSLIRVTREQSPVIYFVTGHGEADPEAEDKGGMSLLKGYLEHENFDVRKLQLAPEGVPSDARLLVVAGPRGPFQGWEVAEIDRYLSKGGDAILMFDPLVFTNFEELLLNYGLELGQGVVVDQENYMADMDSIGLSPVTGKFTSHSLVEGLHGKLVVFPRVRPLRLLTRPDLAGKWSPLVYSSDKSFVETDVEGLYRYGRVQRTPEKPQGEQLLVAVYNEAIMLKPWQALDAKASRETRLVVTGNSHFMRNLALDVYSNYLLAMNLFNWAAGEQEFISLIPKKRSASRIYLTERQTNIIFYSSVLIIPELIAIIGIAVWWRRK